MKIGSVSNAATFKGAQETSAVTAPNDKKDIKEVIKDNKGKIALGLSALAAVGIAAVAITRGKKVSVPNVSSEVSPEILSEVPSKLSIDDFRKIGKFDKGSATVNGKPFSGIIDVTNKRGKYVLEYADGALKSSTKYFDGGEFNGYKIGLKPYSKKVYTEKDGVRTMEIFYFDYSQKNVERWVPGSKTIITDNKIIKEHTDLSGEILQDIVEKQQDGYWKKTFQEMIPDPDFQHANYERSYIATKDVVGNIIAKKPVYTPKSHISSQETVLKQANKYVDKDGNSVVETLKNGKLYARQTTKIADDGSRQIAVEYFDDGSKDYKKVIDIAKDGKRKESETGKRFISL